MGMSAAGQVRVTRMRFPSCLKQTNKTDRTDETVIVKILNFRPQRATIPAYRKPNEVSPMTASLAALRVSRLGHREQELHRGPTEVKADMVCREEHLQ